MCLHEHAFIPGTWMHIIHCCGCSHLFSHNLQFCFRFFRYRPTLPVLLPAASGQGLQISGQLERKDGQVVYHLHLSNGSTSVLDSFMMQINKNSMGLAAPAGVLAVGHVDHWHHVTLHRIAS